MTRDDYADYAAWLHQEVYWPKKSNFGHDEQVLVDGMAPQYAASALAKLLRWAYDEGYPRLNIYDGEERVTHVRRSPLAVRLALRAIGLYEVSALKDYYDPLIIASPRTEVNAQPEQKNLVMKVLSYILGNDDAKEELGVSSMAELAEDIVDGLDRDGYKVISPSLLS